MGKCALIGCLAWLAAVPASGEDSITEAQASGPLVREVLGEVHSERRQLLHVEVTGTQVSERLPRGARVSAGQVLLQLDDREARGRRRQAEAITPKPMILCVY